MKLTKESPGCARDESGLSLLVGVPVEYGTFDQRLVKAGAFIEEVIHRVNLHDELVEALRRSLDFNESVFSCTCNYGGDTCVIHQAKAALAKVERKGK